jgi:hypothetical protein
MSPPAIRHFVGLDLGQAHDSTAVALLAQEVERGRPCYVLRHLDRWPPGTPYPRIAEDVGRLLLAVPRWACRLVVDQTAVGRAVAALFRPAAVTTRLVLISAGHAVTSGEDGCTHVPKKELVSVLQVLLQTQRLKVAASLPLAETLSREMASFRASVQVAGSEPDVNWRQREHDDLVLAVALAAWEGERNPLGFGKPLILRDRAWEALGRGM